MLVEIVNKVVNSQGGEIVVPITLSDDGEDHRDNTKHQVKCEKKLGTNPLKMNATGNLIIKCIT